ncbi:MAG: EAL domain-containing protein [Planctomycetales bacterium]|nr:EAL domain-containing protein [Planctomycetales bacterium]
MNSQLAGSANNTTSAQPDDPPGTWFLDGSTDVEHSMNLRVELRQFPFKVGRGVGLSLTLDHSKVSKLHAVINQEGTQIWLQDLGSKNGTRVNGRRVTDCVRLRPGDDVQFADMHFQTRHERVGDKARIQQDSRAAASRAALDLKQILATGDIVPHYQPIVRLATGDRLGYEVLARSHYRGLREASVMFLAAQRLGVEAELSELCRREGLRQGKTLPGRPTFFINTHATELNHRPFLDSLREFREQNRVTPIVLEIQEREIDDLAAIRDLRVLSRGFDLQLAFDNVRDDPARLRQLLDIGPDYIKFDIAMIHGIDQASPQDLRSLKSLVDQTCHSGATPMAEGVERHEEAVVCRQLGFVFAQGHHLGRPMRGADIVAEHVKSELQRSTDSAAIEQTCIVNSRLPAKEFPRRNELATPRQR